MNSRWLAIPFVLGAITLAASAQAPPVGPHKLSKDGVSPDSIRQLAGLLGQLGSGASNKGIEDAVKRIAPGVDPKQYADLFRQDNPWVNGLKERFPQLDKIGKDVPEPTPLPMPNIDVPPPSVVPPSDPPFEDLPRPRITPRNRDPLSPFVQPDRVTLPDGRTQRLEAARRAWEQRFGSLQNSPAVKRLFEEMLAGNSPFDPAVADGLIEAMSKSPSGTSGLTAWANESGLFDGWEPPDLPLGLGKFDLSGFNPDFSVGSAPSPLPSFSSPSVGEGSWLSVILLVVVSVGAIVLWRFWPRIAGSRANGPQPLPGLGPWPLDPRTIADRDGLVRAFEYLSVLVCGHGARTWNHVAIADALRRTVGHSEDAAEPLARLYALARYSPIADPLPPDAIAEARSHLCRLAGVPAP